MRHESSPMGVLEEVRSNTDIQAQLADLCVKTLQNERIPHDVIKEALVKLFAVVVLTKDNQVVWENVKTKKAQEQRQFGEGHVVQETQAGGC